MKKRYLWRFCYVIEEGEPEQSIIEGHWTDANQTLLVAAAYGPLIYWMGIRPLLTVGDIEYFGDLFY